MIFYLLKNNTITITSFYGDKNRIKNIEEAIKLWINIMNPNPIYRRGPWIMLRKILRRKL